MVASNDLLAKLAGQAIRAKKLVESLSDSVLPFSVNEVQQLEPEFHLILAAHNNPG